jgi:hypothetical protein
MVTPYEARVYGEAENEILMEALKNWNFKRGRNYNQELKRKIWRLADEKIQNPLKPILLKEFRGNQNLVQLTLTFFPNLIKQHMKITFFRFQNRQKFRLRHIDQFIEYFFSTESDKIAKNFDGKMEAKVQISTGLIKNFLYRAFLPILLNQVIFRLKERFSQSLKHKVT